jgi:DNA polymerase (family 10)
MTNTEIARVLDLVADLLELAEGDRFRIGSYRRAARSILDANEEVSAMAAAGRLTEIPHVGKGIADRITQYINTGCMDVLEELQAKFPPTIVELLGIPGMGPKKVALVYQKFGVCDLEGLKRIIESGELAAVKGLGEASVKKIADGIAFKASSSVRTPLGVAMTVAEDFVRNVGSFPGVRRVEFAGSLRRGCETIGDIDLLCDADDGASVIAAFCRMPRVARVLAQGDTKGSITVGMQEGGELQIDLRVVDEPSFAAAWQYFTGSKDHNVRLRERAVAKKWRLNEYGLFDGEKRIAGETEEEIYQKLGMPFIPPELRENRGEFERGYQPPGLVTLEDIRGDLHMHTVASDGQRSIIEMAECAKQRGYTFIAICDHSKSSVIANGLSIERMEQHIRDIRRANEQIQGINILAGTECDILPDGSMDYPDEILAQCDWVMASIHSAMTPAKDKMSPTERTLAAIENRYVCAIGHPSGRLINRRAPMEIDMQQVIVAAAKNGTMLEVNANWRRLDLKDLHIRQALAAGVMLTINTDAHSFADFDQMRFGVITARRGGATPADVANCLTLQELRDRIAAKRKH